MFADRGIVWTQKRFVAFLHPNYLGRLASHWLSSSMRAIRSNNAGLSGLPSRQNALAKVYSWPEHTVVVSGNAQFAEAVPHLLCAALKQAATT